MPDSKRSRREHEARLKELRKKISRKVEYHLQKAYIGHEDFYNLIREFFLELLEKNYEPTYEEIIREVEGLEHEYLTITAKQKREVKELLELLSAHEYQGIDLNKEQAHSILKKFHKLAKELTHVDDASIDYALREGLRAVENNDTKKALDWYQRARALYDTLSDDERKHYHKHLLTLFHKLPEDD